MLPGGLPAGGLVVPEMRRRRHQIAEVPRIVESSNLFQSRQLYSSSDEPER